MPIEAKADQNQDADKTEGERDENAELSRGMLRLDRDGESPLAEEIPDADAQMKGAGENADQRKGQEVWIHEEVPDFVVGGTAMRGPALRVEMPGDVNESDQAGVALRGIEPIPYPGIRGDVGLAAQPDINPVKRVVKHRKEDGGPFDEWAERDGLQFVGNLIVFCTGDKNRTIRPEMLGEEGAYGNDAG